VKLLLKLQLKPELGLTRKTEKQITYSNTQERNNKTMRHI